MILCGIWNENSFVGIVGLWFLFRVVGLLFGLVVEVFEEFVVWWDYDGCVVLDGDFICLYGVVEVEEFCVMFVCCCVDWVLLSIF